MYKKYNGSVIKNKVVQVSQGDTITNLPLVKAGTTLTNIDNSSFKRNSCCCKVDNDKVVLFAGNIIHILKYVNGTMLEIKRFILDGGVDHGIRWDVSTLQINENNVLIIYGVDGNLSYNFLEINESKNIYNITERFIIDADKAIVGVSSCKLNDDKIIIGVVYQHGFVNGVFLPPAPYILVTKIENNNRLILSSKTAIFSDLKEGHKIKESGVNTMHLVALDKNNFVLFNNLNRSSGLSTKGYISVANVNEMNEVKRYDLLQTFTTREADHVLVFTKPLFLGNNKILYFEEGTANIVEFIFNDNTCNVKALSSLRVVFDFGEFATGYLSSVNGEKDILIIDKRGYRVINLSDNLTKINIKESEGTTDFYNKIGSVLNLENNVCFYCTNNSSPNGEFTFTYIAKRNESNGNIIGLAAKSDLVCVDGICTLKDIDLSIGKKYYYDVNGDLTLNAENNTYLGYSIATNKIMLTPVNAVNTVNKTIIRKYDSGGADANRVVQISNNKIKNIPVDVAGKILGFHIGNGDVLIKGFAKNLNIELAPGKKYYYDTNGILTNIAEGNNFIGYAVSKNTLYVPNYIG